MVSRSEMKKVFEEVEAGKWVNLENGMTEPVRRQLSDAIIAQNRAQVALSAAQDEHGILQDKCAQLMEQNREWRMSAEAGDVIIDGLRSQIELYQAQLAEKMGGDEGEVAEISELLEGD